MPSRAAAEAAVLAATAERVGAGLMAAGGRGERDRRVARRLVACLIEAHG